MKKKINARLVLIAVAAVFATMVLITLVYYDLFRMQVMEDLKTYSRLLRAAWSQEAVQAGAGTAKSEEVRREPTKPGEERGSSEASGEERGSSEESGENRDNLAGAGDRGLVAFIERTGAEAVGDGMRITLVGPDGRVLYDNEAVGSEMANHGQRPEIAGAIEQGEGRAVRKSETLSRSTFYYAVLLGDGSVLRVAKEAGSLYSIFWNALPSLLLVAAVLVGVCMVMAHCLTRSLVKPIERLAEGMEGENGNEGYEELKPFIQKIKQQHEDIMKNARVRQEFTANVSHELKTPLTSISGYAELIETGMASEDDVVRFARGIRSSANRLLNLIDDIIRLSELDGEKEEISMERLNLFAMADACVEMLSMSAEKHGVSLELKGMDCFLTGNRQMIEELLYNLCDNAIRYNNEGGSVTVEAYPLQRGAFLKVSDTGIGIPREHQERIFERFYRVDKSRSKSTGGTGLGLAIVKHIIEKHKAEVSLESEAGKGTVVTVRFPG